MIVALLLCAMAAQAQTASVKWNPATPEVGVCLIATGTATSDNGVAAGVPFTIEGEINASGVTDSRGQFRAKVKPVPDVSHLKFRVRVGNGPLSDEYVINVAQGSWEEVSTISGSFTASYSITDTGGSGGNPWGWPGVSWSGSTNGSAYASPGQTSLKDSVSCPVTGSSAKCTVSAVSGMGGASDCAASITGGTSSTENKIFIFHPTTVHKHIPSMSVVSRQGSISVSCFATINNGGLPQQGSARAAASAASSFVPAAALTASSDSGLPPVPINITRSMPPLMMGGGTITVPMSRGASGQSMFDLGKEELAIYLIASGSSESGDSASRSSYSAE